MFRRALTYVPVALVACTTTGDGGCGSDDDSGNDVIMLLNENNYTWTGGLDIPAYVTAELVDIHFDWSGMDKDMLCHDMDPVADVDSVGLTRFPLLAQDDVGGGLTNNSLKQSDTNGYVSCEPGDRTECWLSEFSFGGTAYNTIEVYEEGGGTFLFNLQTGTQPGQGARFVAFLEPTTTSDVTELVLEPTCDIVSMEFDLTALAPLDVPATGPWTVDWSLLSVSGNGLPVIPGDLDEVMVASYDGLSTEELSEQFLDLDLLATDLYTLQLDGGTQATLGGLVTADGKGFEGFTTDQTWLLALRCNTCTNPSPVFMTVVNVTE